MSTNLSTTFKSRIRAFEGFRSKPYLDIRGIPTFGYGRTFITLPEAEYLLSNDETRILNDLTTAFPWFSSQPEPVKLALMDMTYHMGLGGLKTFKKMLAAIEKGDYKTASAECLDSSYGRKFTSRARSNADLILLGAQNVKQ